MFAITFFMTMLWLAASIILGTTLNLSSEALYIGICIMLLMNCIALIVNHIEDDLKRKWQEEKEREEEKKKKEEQKSSWEVEWNYDKFK